MTKIFEALELANRQNAQEAEKPAPKEPEKTTREPTETPAPIQIAPVIALNLEQTLTGLYNGITSLLPGAKGRCVLFIGVDHGAGASTLIREFAKVAAIRLEKSVLLLDADAHKPTHMEAFDLHQRSGWDAILDSGGDEELEALIQPIGRTGLSVSQLQTPNASSPLLYESPQLRNAFDRLKNDFDLILVDAPPAAKHSEGVALASKVDGVVLVLECEKTHRRSARELSNRIAMAGGRILGAIVNKRRHHLPPSLYNRL